MSRKFFYATTNQIPKDGWGLNNIAPDPGDEFQLKPIFGEPVELDIYDKANPWSALDGQSIPHDTVMVACWIESTPGVIDLYGDMSYFVGELRQRVHPEGGPPGSYIVLADGRGLYVAEAQLEFVYTITPEAFGITPFRGRPTFCQQVYVYD